jgi:hypothetical protein
MRPTWKVQKYIEHLCWWLPVVFKYSEEEAQIFLAEKVLAQGGQWRIVKEE